MVKKYISERIAHRWAKYYQKKRPAIRAYQIRPHPLEFGFAIFVKPTSTAKFYPIGS